ncbi:YgiT-type zinc finger protein [Ruminococcus sp. CLA-AA-H200]|uniref:YgiT-type zinc finger protein n=1 Tax=Ruminococcus turbiniformis TaxID=2881258 RepID=A0ABS8FWU5_9FIRM|nr:YgiT-type zinc finger protein [Ruminococcus turbiniformis]MCC2254423.1 YgiT-type zinc finger protein [Ruminococcus turbiniformis]
MRCSKCGATVEKGVTTSVTDTGECLVIVRNVPCYKCVECGMAAFKNDGVMAVNETLTISGKEYTFNASGELI